MQGAGESHTRLAQCSDEILVRCSGGLLGEGVGPAHVCLCGLSVGGVGWGLIGVGCATAWDEIVGAGHGFLLRLGWGCGSGLPHTRIINRHHPLLLSLALLTQLTLLKPGRAHRDAQGRSADPSLSHTHVHTCTQPRHAPTHPDSRC